MKRIINILAAATVLALALTGCMRKDAVIFRGVSDVDISLQGSPRMAAVLEVENTSNKNITLRDAAFRVTAKDGTLIGKVMVENDLFIPKRSVTSLYVPLKISIDNPLRALALLGDLEKSAPSLFVTGSVTVKAGCVRKKIEVNETPLSEVVKYFKGMPASRSAETAALESSL